MLLEGINHVALLTSDTDRLVEFYTEVFGATWERVKDDPGFRLTIIYLGGVSELNVFELQGNDESTRQTPMFGRGRLDHLGVQAASLEAFEELRDRLMARGATDGFVTDFGPGYSLFFRDPDGLEAEVNVPNPDALPGVWNDPGTPALRYHPEGTPPPDRVTDRQLPSS